MTEAAWTRIEPLLPAQLTARRPWRDHRQVINGILWRTENGAKQVINGILWKLRTGAPWRDVPDRYGPWKTCHERLRVWTRDGTWERILAEA